MICTLNKIEKVIYAMDDLKKILFACSCIFAFAALSYVLGFLSSMWGAIRYKKPIRWNDFNPIAMISSGVQSGKAGLSLLLSLVIVVGAVNLILSHTMVSNEIGAFYEAENYNTKYEATLFIKEKPIFCIVNVWRHSEPDPVYTLTEIHLPYGKFQYIDAEYDPDYNNSVHLGYWGHRCDIELIRPITDTSFSRLKNEIVSNYGEFCGSMGAEKFHLLDCWNVKNIKAENLVYFDTALQAEALGYEMCVICANRY